MHNIKKHHVLVLVVLAVLLVLIVGFSKISHRKKNYSLADFGIPPLAKADCSSLKDIKDNSPVVVSFDVPNVSTMRDKIKVLFTKYNGHITSDSFSSYPPMTDAYIGTSQDSPAYQDNATITVTFDKSQSEFLTELSALVKSSGGVDTGYNYTDGSQPLYDGGYSSYSSCIDMMHIVSADVLQLEVLTKALKREHSPANISILSQAISSVRSTLQMDVNSLNSFFATSDKPSVSISIYTLQR